MVFDGVSPSIMSNSQQPWDDFDRLLAESMGGGVAINSPGMVDQYLAGLHSQNSCDIDAEDQEREEGELTRSIHLYSNEASDTLDSLSDTLPDYAFASNGSIKKPNGRRVSESVPRFRAFTVPDKLVLHKSLNTIQLRDKLMSNMPRPLMRVTPSPGSSHAALSSTELFSTSATTSQKQLKLNLIQEPHPAKTTPSFLTSPSGASIVSPQTIPPPSTNHNLPISPNESGEETDQLGALVRTRAMTSHLAKDSPRIIDSKRPRTQSLGLTSASVRPLVAHRTSARCSEANESTLNHRTAMLSHQFVAENRQRLWNEYQKEIALDRTLTFEATSIKNASNPISRMIRGIVQSSRPKNYRIKRISNLRNSDSSPNTCSVLFCGSHGVGKKEIVRQFRSLSGETWDCSNGNRSRNSSFDDEEDDTSSWMTSSIDCPVRLVYDFNETPITLECRFASTPEDLHRVLNSAGQTPNFVFVVHSITDINSLASSEKFLSTLIDFIRSQPSTPQNRPPPLFPGTIPSVRRRETFSGVSPSHHDAPSSSYEDRRPSTLSTSLFGKKKCDMTVALVGNKLDLEPSRVVSQQQVRFLAKKYGVTSCFEISAVLGQKSNEILLGILDQYVKSIKKNGATRLSPSTNNPSSLVSPLQSASQVQVDTNIKNAKSSFVTNARRSLTNILTGHSGFH